MTSASTRLRERAESGAAGYRPTRALRSALVLDELERFAGARPLRVLDAGCGEGLLTVELARRHPAWTVVGVDVDPGAVERGRRRAQEARTGNASFREAELAGGLGSDEYDAVLAVECLTEFPEPEAALDGLARSLRPGGLFVVHVPEATWRPVLTSSPATWRHELRHGFTPAELRDLLERRGLRVEEVRPTAHAAVHLGRELRDRIKTASVKRRLLAYPLLRAAVAAERAGLRVGSARALLVVADRP